MRLILAILLLAFSASAQMPPRVMDDLLMAVPKSSAWAPTNAYGWWSADSLSFPNGTLVTNWNDLTSTHNFRVFSNTVSYAPYFTNSVVGSSGKPALYWTTNNTTALTNDFGETISQPFTVFTVAKRDDPISGRTPVFLDGVALATRVFLGFNLDGSGTAKFGLSAGTTVNLSSTLGTSWTVLTVHYNQGSTFVRTNGVLAGTVGSTIGSNGTSGITLGDRYVETSTLFRFTGGIAEFIVYKGLLATNDMQWVENNLKTKYGL